MFNLLQSMSRNADSEIITDVTTFGGGEVTLYTVSMTILVVLLGIILYFGPALVAFYRDKRNTPALFIGNLLLGWNYVMWALLLVWALTYSYEDESFRQK